MQVPPGQETIAHGSGASGGGASGGDASGGGATDRVVSMSASRPVVRSAAPSTAAPTHWPPNPWPANSSKRRPDAQRESRKLQKPLGSQVPGLPMREHTESLAQRNVESNSAQLASARSARTRARVILPARIGCPACSSREE